MVFGTLESSGPLSVEIRAAPTMVFDEWPVRMGNAKGVSFPYLLSQNFRIASLSHGRYLCASCLVPFSDHASLECSVGPHLTQSEEEDS